MLTLWGCRAHPGRVLGVLCPPQKWLHCGGGRRVLWALGCRVQCSHNTPRFMCSTLRSSPGLRLHKKQMIALKNKRRRGKLSALLPTVLSPLWLCISTLFSPFPRDRPFTLPLQRPGAGSGIASIPCRAMGSGLLPTCPMQCHSPPISTR